jgi:hypothetical protein
MHERGDHLSEQIGTRLTQLLRQPTGQVDTRWSGHRVNSSGRALWKELVEDHAVAVSHLDATLSGEDQTPRVWTQLQI